jgi:hypothetical protein
MSAVRRRACCRHEFDNRQYWGFFVAGELTLCNGCRRRLRLLARTTGSAWYAQRAERWTISLDDLEDFRADVIIEIEEAIMPLIRPFARSWRPIAWLLAHDDEQAAAAAAEIPRALRRHPHGDVRRDVRAERARSDRSLPTPLRRAIQPVLRHGPPVTSDRVRSEPRQRRQVITAS